MGTTLGPYRIDRELGSGGMGTVWHAIGADGVAVAIKVVHPHLLATRDFRERFDREANVGLAIRHPNVVATIACLDVESGGKQVPALVLEYVEGRSLVELLAELRRVPEDLCRHLAREIARGLAAIHAAGIVHRDLKPGNVLITPGHDVKVMDLGLARSVSGDDRLSSTGVFVGTASYAPPEQFRGAQTLDPRSDLYSLGAMLFELATGEVPFRADSIGDLVRQVLNERPRRPGTLTPQLSPFFEELLLQLLAKSPAERFASAMELGEILDAGERSSWWIEAGSQATKLSKRPSRRVRIPRETAMWGREREFADLVVAWEAAKAGDGRVVLLEGETGIGKSRLVEEMLARLGAEDVHLVVGGYPPGGAATANVAFITAYREHFGAEHLESVLRAHLKETPPLVPAFAALLRGEMAPIGSEPLTKDSLQTCFVHATRSLAAEKPLVVVIDDLHFAPEEGRSLFAALAFAVPGHRVLLVGTARPGLPAPWIAELERLGHVTRSMVRRLDEAMVRAHLATMFGKSLGAEDLASRIAAKAGGNPFFVFEILRSLRDSGHVSQAADGAWSVASRAAAVDIPSSVKDLVAARLSALADEDREVLEAAACHGFEFDGRLVAEALDRPRLDVLRRLGRIERETSLVRAAGARFVFDHHAVHETLYGGMPQQLREEIHAAVGDALERTSGAAGKDVKDVDGALAVEICEQFVRSTDAPRGLRYLDPALTHLERGYLNDAAIRLSGLALAVAGLVVGNARAETLLRRAGRLRILGLKDGVVAALTEAMALADECGDPALRARVRVSLGYDLRHLSRYDDATARLEEALVLARAAGDRRSECGATESVGDVLFDLGRYGDAQERYEWCLTLARQLGDRSAEATAVGGLGRVFHATGRYAEALESMGHCLSLCREIGNRYGEAGADANVGVVLSSLGRYEEAREHYERSLAICRAIGSRRGEAAAVRSLGSVHLAQGRRSDAWDQYERAFEVFREVGDRRGEAGAVEKLGWVRFTQGDIDQAGKHFERSRLIYRDIGDRRGEASSECCLGEAAQSSGRLAEALDLFQRSFTMSREIGNRHGEAWAQKCIASALAEHGEIDAARERLVASIAEFEALGLRHLTAEMRLALGTLHIEAGAMSLAGESLVAACELAANSREPGTETLARCRLACLPEGNAEYAAAGLAANEERLGAAERREARFLLWQATGDRAHLAEAKRLLDEALAKVPAEHHAAMLANVRVNREITAAAKAAGL